MRKTFAALLSAAAAWLLLVAMLLTGVFICTASTSFYEREYEKYDNAAVIGVSDEKLMEITDVLLDYLWGRRDNLDMQAEINGQTREVFTQREKDHMVDVRYLIELARNALVVTLVGGILLWGAAVWIAHKEKGGIKYAGIGYLAGAALLFLAVGVVVLLAMRDFTAVFIKFHEIFFTNDLWLLNADDMLIMMVPEPFFVDCAALIAIVFGIGFILTAVLALLMIFLRAKKKKTDKPLEETAIAAIGGEDGDSFYRIEQGEESERPDVEEIFARLGLEDEKDEDDEALLQSDDRNASQQEVLTAAPVAAEFPVRTPDGSELSVRFEMKLDLKVEKTEDGKLVLTMDPERKPQVSLSSMPGQLSFTIYDEPAALPQPAVYEEQLSLIPERMPIEGPVPSPEELLKQMDELMKGFPRDGQEGEA